jgi:aspartate carbamoyltransferase catalytic subunit
MLRLGGKVLHVDAGKGGNSSSSKGESLDDTIRCLECYTDVTVLRHPVKGSVPSVALGGGTTKPVINAGDGTGEHPTQALLDMFTVWDELGLSVGEDSTSGEKKHEGPLVVVMLGDLKHGRTVHSLAMLLARSKLGHELILRYCSPASLAMPDYVKEYCAGYDGVRQEECDDLKEAVKGAHVLYVTRVQKERFENAESYEEVKVCTVAVLDDLG